LAEGLKYRIAVGVEYDGTAYAGWQTQQHARGVQQVVEAAFTSVAAQPVSIICAGRTDAGVHARWQVAHFDTNAYRRLRAWLLGSNSELPCDISIPWVCRVPMHFHARYSAEARTYRYLILNRSTRSAFATNRAACVFRPLDHESMARAAVFLHGSHDFSAFRSAECQANSPVRRMEKLVVTRRGEWVVIEATANAYLHHMMRNIVGLLIAIGRGDAPADWAKEVLEGRDRKRNAATAPAEGLYFWGVRYPRVFAVPTPPEDDPTTVDWNPRGMGAPG
jgi:tRNA pseudouridine38-40 synthase